MRPASLRRYGVAAIAGGLLLASGTVPGFASDVDKPEGTPTDRVTGEADRGLGTWIRALVSNGRDTFERTAGRVASWGNKIFVPVVPVPAPVKAPVGVIVDDGAPF